MDRPLKRPIDHRREKDIEPLTWIVVFILNGFQTSYAVSTCYIHSKEDSISPSLISANYTAINVTTDITPQKKHNTRIGFELGAVSLASTYIIGPAFCGNTIALQPFYIPRREKERIRRIVI